MSVQLPSPRNPGLPGLRIVVRKSGRPDLRWGGVGGGGDQILAPQLPKALPPSPALPHPNSGLPEFGTLSWPKSDKSDFGWGGSRPSPSFECRSYAIALASRGASVIQLVSSCSRRCGRRVISTFESVGTRPPRMGLGARGGIELRALAGLRFILFRLGLLQPL